VADRAVAAAQPRRVVAQRLAAGQPVEHLLDDRPIGVEVGHRMPDVLVGRVAEHCQLGLVGAQDAAIGVDPVQADAGVLEEVAQLLFAGPQRVLRPAPLGHVAEHQHAAGDRAVSTPNRRGSVVDRPLGAVCADQEAVVGEADGRALAQRSQRRIVDGLARVLVDDAEDLAQGAAGCSVARPAGESLGDGVQRHDAGGGVGHDHPVPDRLQRRAQTFGLEAMVLTRAAQGVGAGADQPAGAGEDHDADDVRRLEPLGLDARDEEETRRDGGAQRRGQQTWSQPAVPCGGHDGAEEGEIGKVAAEPMRQDQPPESGGERRCNRYQVGKPRRHERRRAYTGKPKRGGPPEINAARPSPAMPGRYHQGRGGPVRARPDVSPPSA
jgi:hypothetical protein